jgi:hypothetical protein
MVVEEAVEELNHSDYQFVVFRTRVQSGLSCIDTDGTLGLIHA